MFSFSIDKIFQKERQEFSFRRLLEQIFIDDWMMKLLALTITLALWLGVTGLSTPKTERLRNVPLKLSVSNDMEITNTPIKEVDLVVTGDKRKIEPIKSEDLIINLDLADRQSGDHTIDLTSENVNVELPTGIKLEEIQPSKIAIKLERVEKREIPVKAVTINDVPEGYEIYGLSVVPARIPVRGPESYINSLDFISTDKIDLKDRTEDFSAQQVPLNILNSKITIVDDTSVDVFFRIGEKRIERLFIVKVKNAAAKERTATVVLYGVRSLLVSLKKEDVQVELVDSELKDSSLRLSLPTGIQEKVEVKKLAINGM